MDPNLGLIDEHVDKARIIFMFRTDLFDDELFLKSGNTKGARQIDLGHAARGDFF